METPAFFGNPPDSPIPIERWERVKLLLYVKIAIVCAAIATLVSILSMIGMWYVGG